MKPKRTSCPYAPDSILEARRPIVSEMLEGNYPDDTKLDQHRFRPICLLEFTYPAVDSRIAKRLLKVIDDHGPIDRGLIGFSSKEEMNLLPSIFFDS